MAMVLAPTAATPAMRYERADAFITLPGRSTPDRDEPTRKSTELAHHPAFACDVSWPFGWCDQVSGVGITEYAPLLLIVLGAAPPALALWRRAHRRPSPTCACRRSPS